MKIIISERQLGFISEQWYNDPKHPEWRKYAPTDYEKRELKKIANQVSVIDKFSDFYEKHQDLIIFGTAFIPVVGPYISGTLATIQASESWTKAKTDEERALIALGVACNLIYITKLKHSFSLPATLKEIEYTIFRDISKKLITKEFDKLNSSEINVIKEVGKNQKQIASTIQQENPRFDLSRDNVKPKSPKQLWDYQKTDVGSGLELINNPKGQKRDGAIAEIRNKENPSEYVQLFKKTSSEGEEYYYFKSVMVNSIQSGKAHSIISRKIPSGARIGEPATGSLSTDSFYLMLRRCKQGYKSKVDNMITLNAQGSKKFQNYIHNTVEDDVWPRRLLFTNEQSAKGLSDVINVDIYKSGVNIPSKVVKLPEGYYVIEIPNIQIFKP